MSEPSGYSGTPLPKKLGIHAGAQIAAKHAPKPYAELVAPLPAGVRISERATRTTDLVHVFVVERAVLQRELTSLRKTIRPDAAVWVSWPKKAAKVPTDVTEDVIRQLALPLGFVDVKVCAVDATWSGLKLVIRKEQRA
jgi:uncharacterized membrane protein